MFEAEIKPLIQQIMAICEREGLPVLMMINYAQEGHEEHTVNGTCVATIRKFSRMSDVMSVMLDLATDMNLLGALAPAIAQMIQRKRHEC